MIYYRSERKSWNDFSIAVKRNCWLRLVIIASSELKKQYESIFADFIFPIYGETAEE